MEFDINVNNLLRDVITKVDSRLQACQHAVTRFQDARKQLFDIINKMGEASARAQGLGGAITTGRKLEMSDHDLYVMKDSEGSRNHGAVVGFLKIGRKRLFVYDRHGQQWEMNPLCVLDFYVHESRQRTGCGRRLFDFMLKDANSSPQHLAVDRPSHKFASFLAKHYGLQQEIPQVNNFVIFDGFFTKRPDGDFIHNRRNTNPGKPADYPNQAGTPAQNGMPSNNYNNNKMYPYQQNKAAGVPSTLPRQQDNRKKQESFLKDLNINPRSALSASPQGLSETDQRNLSAGSSGGGGGRGGALAGLHLQTGLYSRHAAPPPVLHPPPGSTRPPSGARNVSRPPSGSVPNGRPPSGSRNTQQMRGNSPGPTGDYRDSLNLHQNYQGRSGHLHAPPDPRAHTAQLPSSGKMGTAYGPAPAEDSNKMAAVPGGFSGGFYTNPSLHGNADSSWTVFGVLRNQNQHSARTYGRSRLW